jgi:glycerol-3-phosphate O-acyltransferase
MTVRIVTAAVFIQIAVCQIVLLVRSRTSLASQLISQLASCLGFIDNRVE